MFAVTIFVLLLILTSVVGMLVSEEVQAQWLRACRYLVVLTSRRLPNDSQARFQEEWLAELAAHSGGPLSHMWWAISLFIARGRIATEVRRMLPAEESEPIRSRATLEVPTAAVTRIEVRTVAEASSVAARILEIATRQADEIIAKAQAAAKDRAKRMALGLFPDQSDDDVAVEAPNELSTGLVITAPDPSSAAARLLEIATRNAEGLIEDAANQAESILRAWRDESL
jgi:hypothetical protein